jgi:hypothetical protein
MWSKPFKPPLLKVTSKSTSQNEVIDLASSSPPAKKRRLGHIVDGDLPASKPKPTISLAVSAPRKPLISVINPVTAVAREAAALRVEGQEAYYRVLWYFHNQIYLVIVN